jgi:hypothetical protein
MPVGKQERDSLRSSLATLEIEPNNKRAEGTGPTNGTTWLLREY